MPGVHVHEGFEYALNSSSVSGWSVRAHNTRDTWEDAQDTPAEVLAMEVESKRRYDAFRRYGKDPEQDPTEHIVITRAADVGPE